MISFELSKEIEKEVFSSCHGGRGGGVGRKTKKNSESPCEIEPQIFGFRAPTVYH